MMNNRKRKKQKKLQAKREQSLISKQQDGHLSSDSEEASEDPLSHAQKLNSAGWNEEQLGFTSEDLDTTIKVIRSLGHNIAAFKGPPFKSLRGALHPLIEEQMKNYDGKGRKRRDFASVQTLKEQDREWINKSALRAKRLAALEELSKAEATGTCLMVTHMGEVDEVAKSLKVARVPDGVAELDDREEDILKNSKQTLNVPIPCYTCKRPFVDLHFFYDQLCPDCSALNYSKRNETVDLSGRVALVTGARVKIGYRAALKLLRCGCLVIATSRFAADCALRFSKETDFADWSDRIHVYGIDFRDLAAVEHLCVWLRSKLSRLDILINNACQTIRRPAQYYAHLLGRERTPLAQLAPDVRPLLSDYESFRLAHERSASRDITLGPESNGLNGTQRFTELLDNSAMSAATEEADSSPKTKEASPSAELLNPSVTATAHVARNTTGGSSSGVGGRAAEMSQLVVLEEDAEHRPDFFPERAGGDGGALVDVNAQQVDLRRNNSWMLKLHEVPTGEMVEVMAINAIAPAVLNARLKGLMEASPEDWKFIVNVSAMEGKFYRWKTEQHPHTNMAKASLNMMTRTSAQDYVKSGIYMTAVDTGWINDEKPLERAVRHEARHGFQTPLDEVDAAARVLDPIIAPLLARQRRREADVGEAGGASADAEPLYGVFLKDFVKCEW